MWLKDLRQRWLDRPAAGRRAWPASRGHRPRLTVEPLEDRTVPSTFTAVSVSDLLADITAANQAGGANTITLVAGTTFTLTAATDGTNGLPVIAANDNLTIVGNGDIVQRSTARGTPAFRLFDVAAGATLTLENLTLRGGLAFSAGGAIYNLGTLTLSGVTVQNNVAQGPTGASYGSEAYAYGGGIWSGGALTVENSMIRSNQALGGDSYSFGETGDGTVGWSAYGGGLYAAAGGTVTLRNTTVTSNTAKGGTTHLTGVSEYGGKWHFSAQEPGYGGGLYFVPAALTTPGALAYLDAFTEAHVTQNHADSAPNISGSYTLVP